MPRCPLCKTRYANGELVCKIDGTQLSAESSRTASVALPSIPARASQTKGLGQEAVKQAARGARGKGGVQGNLASMVDEITTAAKPEALAARAQRASSQPPPRIATGSGTVAPESKKKDAWSKPFLDLAPAGLDSQNSEEWVGQTLGSYKLVSILGKGGMGCVYRAEHTKLGREVALKVLRSDYAKRKDAVARFFQEARAVNKIRHRNIVDVTDLVELDGGIVFIIMEFLDGTSLTNLMRDRDACDAVRTLSILVQICDGLAAAHSVGIVHRDLKPDNIIVSSDGNKDLVKVLDFGVAKLLDKDDDDDLGLMTVAGSVVGTPAFMSPEQAGGLQVDGRADIYSLGAIMYEMFTKQPLFRGKSFGEFVRMHLNEAPIRPSFTQGGKDITAPVEEVIMMCLEKSPDARFQTAQELRAELLSLLASFESSGELTAHLTELKQSALPVGEASPLREAPADAAVPAYYQVGNEAAAAAAHQSEVVLVSRSSQGSGSQAAIPAPASAYAISGSNPALPQNYGTPLPTNPYAEHLGYGAVSGSSAVLKPRRNLKGVGVGLGIGLAAILALVVTIGGKGNSSKKTTHKAQEPSVADTQPEPKQEPGTSAPDPKVVPPETPDKVDIQPPRMVVLAISSEPTAEVYAAGAATPTCKTTPCQLEINTEDGGSANRRDYILRSENHEDETITINLRDPREKVFVALTALTVADPLPVPEKDEPKNKTGKNNTGKTGKNNTGKTGKNNTGKTGKNNTGKTGKNNTGKNNTDPKPEGDKPKCKKMKAGDTVNPFSDVKPC